MNRLRYIIPGIIFMVSMLTSFLCPESAKARIKLDIKGTTPVIHDDADLFSDYEKVSIIDMANDLSKQTGYMYIIITTNELKDYIAGHELEGIYNDHRNELAGHGTVLFLINTGNKDIPCELQSYKSATETFSHELCTYLNNDVMPKVNEASYFNAVSYVFDKLKGIADGTLSEEHLLKNSKGQGVKYSKFTGRIPYLVISLCIAFIIAALSMYLMYTRSKAAYKKMFINKGEESSSDSIKKYKMYVRSVESTFSDK